MMNDGLVVLSLFDGISCGMVALEKAGIKVSNYYASEIDWYPHQISQGNYPKIKYLGSALNWKQWGDKSRFEAMPEEARDVFLNNHADKMIKGKNSIPYKDGGIPWQHWDIDWGGIDLVTAGFPCQAWSLAGKQLGDKDPRGALFWVTLEIIANVLKHNPNAKFLMENVKMKKEFEDYITHHTEEALGYVEKTLINSALVSAQNRNRFYWTNFKVTQLEDKGILLRDIIDGCEGIYQKARGFNKGGIVQDGKKSSSLTTSSWEHNNLAKFNDDQKALENESATKGGKAYALTARYGGAVAWNSCQRKQRTMIPVEESEDIDPNVYNGVLYRKLTPIECERLQTLPDNYTLILSDNGKQLVSNSQRYKAIGNGWTADVVSHILSCAFK